MREILLTQGKVALVDAEDFEWLNQWKWLAHKHRNTWYVERRGTKENGKRMTIKMHRQILNLKHDDKKQGDHKDRNGLNNTRSNLRICTPQKNSMNRGKYLTCHTSKFKGISWHKKIMKWQSEITFAGKKYCLGYFKNEIDAAKTYDSKAKELFGEFVYTNF